jgi:hypothetical protein
MRVATTPVEIANTVARNIVPLAGILFFEWSAAAVLVLYFADTIFAIAVMFAGLIRYFMPPVEGDGWAARANSEVAVVACALFTAAVFAVPLGIPVFIVLASTDTTFTSLAADPAFRAGLVMQAIAAIWSGAGLYRALRTHTPDDLRLKRRFALVFLRWVAVLMIAYTGVVFLFGGSFAPFVFVAVYVAASIFIDIAPDKFLSAFPGDARNATSPSAPAAPAAASPGKRRKRKR